jgi:serine protease Do
VITSFDGAEIDDPAALVLLLTRTPVGTEVPIDIVRGTESLTLSVRIGRRPREP